MRENGKREVSSLPPGWVWTTLGEIQHGRRQAINPSKTPDQTFEMYSVPSFDTRKPEMLLGSSIGSGKQVVEPGMVLLCKINPRINRVWVVGNYSEWTKIASTEWIPFPKQDGILPEYLCYFLQNMDFREFLTLNVSGVGGSLMRARLEAVEDYSFPLPPFPEQQRIVAKIEELFSELDAGVAALKRVQVALKRYRASVLKAACEGRLVPTEAELARADGRVYEPAEVLLKRILAERRAKWEAEHPGKKYVEPTAPETEGLLELPEGWCWARAEQLCDFITKGTTPAANKLYAQTGDVPFIKVYNLTNRGVLDFAVNPTFIARHTHEAELARSRVYPGDVLMNIVGPPLGKTSLVPNQYPEWNINQAIAVFRPMPSYDTQFLCQCLLTESLLAWAIQRTKTTAGQVNLTLEICRNLPLPVPPIAEQERIVAEVERRLSVVEELEATVLVNLARAARLRQAILKRAFEGRLAPQDPGDEPAEALPAQTHAARSTLGK